MSISAGGKRRIVVVDDHPVVREGLALLINGEDDMTVCGEAASVEEGASLIRRLVPDLAIVDLSLKDSHGIDLVRRIGSLDDGIRVLVYSMHDEGFYAGSAQQAGALGYLSKSASRDQTLQAIRGALSASRKPRRAQARRNGELPKLTPRERQVFAMLGEGLATREIASRLKISVHTVDSHRENIKTKLDLSSGSELRLSALQWAINGTSGT